MSDIGGVSDPKTPGEPEREKSAREHSEELLEKLARVLELPDGTGKLKYSLAWMHSSMVDADNPCRAVTTPTGTYLVTVRRLSAASINRITRRS